ncbi:hypothetical protein D0962_17930 [Leptolyngbyaceae cyanobacterium CCMR0082]|uniref:Phage head morphogenesis domain-containing protein n=1 Tax=Adonisia turfae CCMR0082 TaxID=2304604 RepID=A0A6M0S835_9CYAN|nr:hypothetical protein [Adonisia turfae]NEZ64645.1 hypothetical protein [Adonisia turfae CCMR0082]
MNLDALPYAWDPNIQRFRWTNGAAAGKLASEQAVLSLTSKLVDAEASQLEQLGRDFFAGKLNAREFQQQSGEALRRIHGSSAIIAKRGPQNVTNENWAQITEILKRQFYKGRSADGRPYGLKHLTAEVEQGKVSEAQLIARLRMYAKSGRLSGDLMQRRAAAESGKLYATRHLSPNHVHCASCLAHQQLTPRLASEITPPATNCECRTNCKCYLLFMSLEDAIKGGLSVASGGLSAA